MRFLSLDFETLYCTKSGYTLSKMTAEEYIRDLRFEIIGVSFCYLGERPQWYSGDLAYIRSVLQQLPWHDIFVVGHNMSQFDALILNEVCGCRPAAYGCTLQLARRLHGGKTPDGKNLSNALGSLAKMYQREIAALHGAPLFKGDEVVKADGKRRMDFSPAELAAYGRYCDDDTYLTGYLWRVLSSKLPKSELFIAHLCTKMWAEPRIVLDTSLLEAMKVELAERKAELLTKVADLMGVGTTMAHDERLHHTQKLLRSDLKFAELLRQLGVEPPSKLSPKRKDAEGKPLRVFAFAKTDDSMQELLAYDEGDDETNETVQAVAAARIGSKSTIAESRVERFLGISRRGKLPVPYLYGKSHCDRLAGAQSINMQNLNRNKAITPRSKPGSLIVTPAGWSRLLKKKTGKDKAGRTIVVAVMDYEQRVWCTDPSDKEVGVQAHLAGLRDTIMAPPGHLLVVADSSNIELRTCHHLCKQEDSIELLRAGKDLYADFATSFYGRTITKADEAERQHGKVAELQLQFQSGAESFRKAARIMAGVRLNELEAQTTVDVYRAKRRNIQQMWYAAQRAIPKMASGGGFYLDDWGFCYVEHNAIRMPNGVPMEYHNLRQELLTGFDGTEELTWVYDDREERKMKKLYGGKVVQNCTQRLARDIVFGQKAAIEKRIGSYERNGEGVVMSTHDEVVACVREDRAEATLALMLEEMSQPPKWWPSIPVKAEGDIASRYGFAK